MSRFTGRSYEYGMNRVNQELVLDTSASDAISFLIRGGFLGMSKRNGAGKEEV